MNIGTIIRSILVVATCLNTALMATDVAQFANGTVELVYRVASVILNFIIVFCATYYNNDYTEEAAVATNYMRLCKAEFKCSEVDPFCDGEDEDEEDEEVEDDDLSK